MEFLKVERFMQSLWQEGENKVTALDHVSLTIERVSSLRLLVLQAPESPPLLHIIGGVDVPTSGKRYI